MMRRFLLLAAALLCVVSGAQAQTTAQKLILLSGERVFALDQQPSAFAAYSARRLLRSYAGPLLRLRRASDNAEQDFAPLPNGDFPISSAGSFCASTTCFVSKWYDQSGNGRDAAQATAASQPQLALTRSTLNNRPAVLFGADSNFALLTASIATSVFGIGGYYSGVVDLTGPPVSAGRFYGRDSDNDTLIITSAPKLQFQVVATTNGSWTDASNLPTGAHVVDLLYSQASLSNIPTIAVDGTSRALAATQPTGTITVEAGALALGNRNSAGGRGFPGYMAENLFFASQPSPAQLAALRANQKTYWGTP